MGPHRADIRFLDGRVLELQHRTLALADVKAREAFYQQGLWVYDGRAIGWNRQRVHFGPRGFWWKSGPKRLTQHRWPIFIDVHDPAQASYRPGAGAPPELGWIDPQRRAKTLQWFATAPRSSPADVRAGLWLEPEIVSVRITQNGKRTLGVVLARYAREDFRERILGCVGAATRKTGQI